MRALAHAAAATRMMATAKKRRICEAKKVAAAQRMTFWKCVLELTSLAGELDGSICSSMLLQAA